MRFTKAGASVVVLALSVLLLVPGVLFAQSAHQRRGERNGNGHLERGSLQHHRHVEELG